MLRQLGAQTAAMSASSAYKRKDPLHPSHHPETDEDDEDPSLTSKLRSAWPMLKVWMALETRQFIRASVEDVEDCIKYDLISPNV